MLSAAVAEDKTLFDRLNTELNSFVSHYHPNVGKMLTFENDPGTGRWYYVLECAEGDTLESRIAAKTLSPAEAIAILKQALVGMQSAHAKKILHRDLRPVNIVLGTVNRVSIRNFSFFDLSAEGATARHEYQAPELAKGAMPSEGTDIYSLGVVARKLMTAIGATKFPPDIRRIGERMSTQDPKTRFKTITEAVAALEQNVKGTTPDEAVAAIAVGFQKSFAEQEQLNQELGKAKFLRFIPTSPVALALLGVVAFFSYATVKSVRGSMKGTKFSLATFAGQFGQTVKKMTGIAKADEANNQVIDVKKNAEASMAKRKSEIDAILDEDEPRAPAGNE